MELFIVGMIVGFVIGTSEEYWKYLKRRRESRLKFQFTCSVCGFDVRSDNKDFAVQMGVEHMKSQHNWVDRA